MESATSMEAILFQKGRDFPSTLDNFFKSCIDAYPNLDDVQNTLDNLSIYIMKELGFTFEFEFKEVGTFESIMASKYKVNVSIPSHTAFTPIDPKAVKRMMDLDLDSFKQDSVLAGRLDPVKVKASGFFSEIVFTMFISDAFFDGSLEAEDITNVTLHELGHVWDYCHKLGSTLITSTYVGVATGQLDESLPIERRIEVGNALLKSYGVTQSVNEDSANASVVVALMVGNQNRSMEVRLGRRYEAVREAEKLADQFSSRWGRGVSMTKTMIKIEKSSGMYGSLKIHPKWAGVISTTNVLAQMTMFAVPGYKNAAAKATFGVGGKLILAGSMGVATLGFTLVAMAITTWAFEQLMDMMMPYGKHPPLKERIQFLKQDSVALLKTEIPDSVRKATLADIQSYDTLLDEVKGWDTKWKRMVDYTNNSISGRYRKHLNDKIASELDNNPLYELIAVLKG